MISGEKDIVRVGRKVIGTTEDGIFVKNVKGSKHMLRKPLAWAIDKKVFDKDIWYMDHIMVYDKETEITWEISVSDFDDNKKILDRGHGEQYYVELSKWKRSYGNKA